MKSNEVVISEKLLYFLPKHTTIFLYLFTTFKGRKRDLLSTDTNEAR